MHRRALFQKIENSMHRSMGTSSVLLTLPGNSERLLFARMLGASEYTENGELLGVGDLDESTGKYNVPISVLGKNLIDEELFIERVMATGVSCTLTDETFSFVGQKPYVGTLVMGNGDIKFKSKTRYTIMVKGNFSYAPVVRYCDMQIAFRYTDGTTEDISIKSKIANTTLIYTSAENKTVNGLVCACTHVGGIQMTLGTLGLFEGVFTDYDSTFEPYAKETYTLALDKPLCSIGYISDEIDILSKTLTKKTVSVTLDESCRAEACEEDGIFKLYLDEARMIGTEVLTQFPTLTLDALSDAETGLALPDAEDCVYIKTGSTDTDELAAYLSENPILLHYVAKARTAVPIELDIPYRGSYSLIVVETATQPRRIFYEYI